MLICEVIEKDPIEELNVLITEYINHGGKRSIEKRQQEIIYAFSEATKQMFDSSYRSPLNEGVGNKILVNIKNKITSTFTNIANKVINSTPGKALNNTFTTDNLLELSNKVGDLASKVSPKFGELIRKALVATISAIKKAQHGYQHLSHTAQATVKGIDQGVSGDELKSTGLYYIIKIIEFCLAAGVALATSFSYLPLLVGFIFVFMLSMIDSILKNESATGAIWDGIRNASLAVLFGQIVGGFVHWVATVDATGVISTQVSGLLNHTSHVAHAVGDISGEKVGHALDTGISAKGH